MADLKSLKNTDLIMAFRLVQYNPTPERQGELMQEVVKARYIAPAILEPEPEPGEDGNIHLAEDSKVIFPEVRNPQGEKYFPAFTDMKALEKWDMKDGQRPLTMTFDNYANLILRDGNAAGLVINPFGENIRIDRKLIEAIKQQQMAQLRQRMEEQRAKAGPQEGVKLTFHNLEKYPEQMIEEMREFLKDQPVKKAYIQGVMQGERKGCIFVLDYQGQDKELFAGMSRIAKPYMTGMYMYLASYQSDLGKKATEGLEPFYEI